MTNSGKLISDELTEWLLEAGFILSQCQMSIYYKYAPDRSNFFSYLMFTSVSIGIKMNLFEMVCGYFSEKIPRDILEICTLVHVNKNLSAEGSLHFCGSG